MTSFLANLPLATKTRWYLYQNQSIGRELTAPDTNSIVKSLYHWKRVIWLKVTVFDTELISLKRSLAWDGHLIVISLPFLLSMNWLSDMVNTSWQGGSCTNSISNYACGAERSEARLDSTFSTLSLPLMLLLDGRQRRPSESTNSWRSSSGVEAAWQLRCMQWSS